MNEFDMLLLTYRIVLRYSWFHENGSFSVHPFIKNYQIVEKTIFRKYTVAFLALFEYLPK